MTKIKTMQVEKSECTNCKMARPMRKCKVKGFVVGISGGVDSAVTSTLCAQTGLAMHRNADSSTRKPC
jgi:NAD+ synthase